MVGIEPGGSFGGGVAGGCTVASCSGDSSAASSRQRMDACLYARHHDVPAADVAAEFGLTVAQVERVYRDIDAKRAAAKYLGAAPITLP